MEEVLDKAEQKIFAISQEKPSKGLKPTADGASDTTDTELDGRTYTEGEKNKQRKSSRKVAQ